MTLYEMKLNISAMGYVDNHPRESSFNTETDVTILGDYNFLKKESPRALSIVEGGRTT